MYDLDHKKRFLTEILHDRVDLAKAGAESYRGSGNVSLINFFTSKESKRFPMLNVIVDCDHQCWNQVKAFVDPEKALINPVLFFCLYCHIFQHWVVQQVSNWYPNDQIWLLFFNFLLWYFVLGLIYSR